MSSKTEVEGIEGLAIFGMIGVFAAIPLVFIFDGYVLSILWRWFVVPTFHLAALGIAQAIGISTTFGLLTHQTQPKDKDAKWWTGIASAVMMPAAFLLVGWIVTWFM